MGDVMELDGPGWEMQDENERRRFEEAEAMENKELYKAITGFQSEIGSIPFDSTNPHFKSKYASLTAIWEKIRPVLKKHGLAVTQTFKNGGDTLYCVTRLAHESGQYIDSDLPVLAQDQTPQKMGSGITYARRYGLSAILGLVADEDDDANAAEKSTPIDEGLLLEFQTKIDAAKSGEDLEKIRKEMVRLSESMKKVLRPRYVKKMESFKVAA